MGGFFIDVVIRTIARNVRREVRRKNATKWLVVSGKVSRFRTTVGDWRRLRPVVDYEYEANGRIEYGSVTGFATNNDINAIGDAVNTIGDLRIRFDPDDPAINRALNEDNPRLPFEIDHDA